MTDQRRELLRVRIELIGISPPVWREILIPARYSFWDLHVAIQGAMGWLDYHLHEFRLSGSSRDEALLIGIPSDELWDDSPEVQPGWNIPVIDFLSESGDRAEYEYDFGDGWVHDVTMLGVEPREKGKRYPKCVAGERACPPEDCGGIHAVGNGPAAPARPPEAEITSLFQHSRILPTPFAVARWGPPWHFSAVAASSGSPIGTRNTGVTENSA